MARQLVEEAKRRAGDAPLSLIAANANTPAMRLYADFGFAEAARLPIVKEGAWDSESEHGADAHAGSREAFKSGPGRATLTGGGFWPSREGPKS